MVNIYGLERFWVVPECEISWPVNFKMLKTFATEDKVPMTTASHGTGTSLCFVSNK